MINSVSNKHVYFSFILIAITISLFYKGLSGDFVNWDDQTYVIENQLVRGVNSGSSEKTNNSRFSHTTQTFSTAVSLNYHPLTILSLSWNDNVCRDCFNDISAFPFKFWNMLLHVLNTLLVYFFCCQLTKSDRLVSFLVALIFAVHPMHVESVLWVSERKDLLYSFFFLLATLTYTQFIQKNSKIWWVFTFIAFVLSCLSKAMAVTFPGIIILLYFWFSNKNISISNLFKNSDLKIKLLCFVPFVGVSFFIGLIAINLQSGGDFYGLINSTTDATIALGKIGWLNWLESLQIGSYGLVKYFVSFFYPIELCAFYPYPTEEMFGSDVLLTYSPIIVLGVLGLIVYSLKYTRIVAFGLGFFILELVLVLQFIPVGQVYMADRYSYLAFIGLAFSLVFCIRLISDYKFQKLLFGLTIIYCGWLTILTNNQIDTWQNSESLWTMVIDVHTKKDGVINRSIDYAFIQRGNYYGQYANFVSIKNKDVNLKNNFLQKAVADYNKAIELGTTKAETYEGLGTVSNLQNKPEQALKYYSKALKLHPGRVNTIFNRGVTQLSLKNYKESILDFTAVIVSSQEKKIPALINRGYAKFQVGDYLGAREDFKLSLEIDPNNNFAAAYLDQIASILLQEN